MAAPTLDHPAPLGRAGTPAKYRRRGLLVGIAKWACLAASVVLAGLLAASFHWRVAAWWWNGPAGSERCSCVQLLRGGIRYTLLSSVDAMPSAGIVWRAERQWVPISIWWPSVTLGDKSITTSSVARSADVPDILLPLWMPQVVLAPLAACLLYWDRRSVRRRRRGLCGRCGYDLRGLAVAAVCPECGAKTNGSNDVRDLPLSRVSP